MIPFEFENCVLAGAVLIRPQLTQDRRGYLAKTFESELFAAHGIRFTPVEELESKSCRNTLRGLHFQYRHSQDKLVRVLSGEIYDVAVDLRPDSPTLGRWQGFRLSADNRQILYLPKRFAHGFLVLSGEAVLHYLCGDRYDPDSESGIIWNDSELAIDWPLEENTIPLLSQRDQAFQSFSDFRRSAAQEYQET